MDLSNFIQKNGIEQATKMFNQAVEKFKKMTGSMTFSEFIEDLSAQIEDKFEIDVYEVDEHKFDTQSYWEECKKGSRADQKKKISEALEDFENCLDFYGGKSGLVYTTTEEDA